jgi:beta-N-acetylhexosaminidase
MRITLFKWTAAFTILLMQIFNFSSGSANASYQGSNPALKAQIMLEQLSPEEKVGQLFLVSFNGIDVGDQSQIFDLIVNHHIGGVVLTAANNNFSTETDVPSATLQLITDIQKDAWEPSQLRPDLAETPSPSYPPFIPLFVAISQEGDGAPYDQILSGLTQLPDLMAIGATWSTDLAFQTGNIMGQELTAMGFNMLLGPSLDVLDVVQTGTGEDLGTRTFGGDPYWVGIMGQAYIRGVHVGSNDGMAVIAKHFPGRGGSDRPPEEEVATVRKSLEQLKQIELAPFFSVTGDNTNSQAVTDGLLVSHIRYQGFQGNIRSTTKPVSFDSAALDLIMALPEFSAWRQNGGVVVSDNIGSQAVRKFFDPTGMSFDARQVARNAFLAGNDLLYVDNFIATGDPDQYTTLLRTLDYFTQKYIEDAAFAERVDASVLRLLTLKYRIYPSFELSAILPAASNLAALNSDPQANFEVARQSATLISPSPEDLATIITHAPDIHERIVFITDSIEYQQCNTCESILVPAVDAMQSAVMRLYGPRAGGQVQASNLSSYSFHDLQTLMDDPQAEVQLAFDIERADWIVISQLSVEGSRPESMAFKDFLAQHYELINNKRVLVFAFNAPYYLDATEISKVTAYYGLYSKTSTFIEVAVRILFQELYPTGSLPVSVAGIGYDLITAMSPDPGQIIDLLLDYPEGGVLENTLTPQVTAEPQFFIGDTIPIKTGVILDHNQHPVPDGTVVHFLFTLGGDVGTTQQIETTTINGIARASYRIQSPGVIEIRVVSDPAQTSNTLQLNIIEGQPGMITAIAPTLNATNTPINPLATLGAPVLENETSTGENVGISLLIWVLFVTIDFAAGYGIFLLGKKFQGERWALRWTMIAIMGGLLGILLGRLLFKGFSIAYVLWTILITLVGTSAGWGVAYLWNRFPSIKNALAKKADKKTHK